MYIFVQAFKWKQIRFCYTLNLSTQPPFYCCGAVTMRLKDKQKIKTTPFPLWPAGHLHGKLRSDSLAYLFLKTAHKWKHVLPLTHLNITNWHAESWKPMLWSITRDSSSQAFIYPCDNMHAMLMFNSWALIRFLLTQPFPLRNRALCVTCV